jgi:hypothetical protein
MTSTLVLVLHTPLFLLNIPETYCIVQAGSGKPLPAPGKVCSKYRALFWEKLQYC